MADNGFDGRPFDSESGRSAALVRWRSARRPLALEDVERELPRLTSIESAQQSLEVLRNWGAALMLPGATLNGVVRSVEVWVRAEEVRLDRDHMHALEERVHELEEEKARGWRRG